MTKVFRLHTGGDDTLADWSNSHKYGQDVISKIKDPDGANAKKEITSIPSPFARIDLVKTAFKEVVDSNDLDARTIYHKMVSDTFDIAQIFFNYENMRDKIDIIEWRKSRDLDALMNNRSHIGDTLSTFLQSDAATYNFDKMDSIYILAYKGSKRQGSEDIIGATSPATLFFSSANDLKYLSDDIHFGLDNPFDDDYCPLYKREIKFVKYLFVLRASYSDFSSDFKEVNDYLELTYRKLPSEIKDEVDQAIRDGIGSYNALTFGVSNSGSVSIVRGLNYHVKPLEKPQSDFEIDSDKCEGDRPLVLPVENGSVYADFKYVSAPWGASNKAPYHDKYSLERRHLPHDGTPYPYLTICDFLEEYVMKLSYETNSQYFFDGNKVNNGKIETYLLPIKPLYFSYFDKQRLLGEVARNLKSIEIREFAGGGINVTLRIPVKGGRGYVEYSRKYYEGTTFSTEVNEGGIKNFEFNFALFPNVAFRTDKDAYYRIGVVSDSDSSDKYNLHCYHGATEVQTKETVRNDQDNNIPRCQIYSIDEHRIDYIQVDCANANARGLIVPTFKELANNGVFIFAIDLGTSNTHIEYNVDEQHALNAFDISHDDAQIVTLLKSSRDTRDSIFDADFLPKAIGANQGYSFPIRTVMSAAKNTDWDQEVVPMGHVNVAFTYGKKATYKYNNLFSNIKWSNDARSAQQMRAYIESLMLLLRNKVVMNGGSLPDTKIVWFYPISMTRARVNQLKQLWGDAYEKFFGGDSANVMQMTESVAPYEYYKGQFAGTADIVTIDVGGGTSDVVISSNNNVEYITSFRFAANAIFSNTLNPSSTRLNGIIRMFMGAIKEKLDANNLMDLLGVFGQIENSHNSADMASFFFSLPDNKQIVDKNIAKEVDFNNMLLLDDKHKIIFVLFYTAIIYHVACIMKSKRHRMPRYIAFSGNGSKVVSIVSKDEELMADLAKQIFQCVYGCEYDKDGLEMIINNKLPKEATCKGGIMCDKALLIHHHNTVNNCKLILKGCDNASFATDGDTYDMIDDAYIDNVAKQVKEFVDTFFELNKTFKFSDNFAIDRESVEMAKNVCYRDIDTFVRNGLAMRIKEVGKDQPVEETLFFYPIIGIMNALADKISEKYQK